MCFDDLADIPSAAVAHFGVVPVEYLVQKRPVQESEERLTDVGGNLQVKWRVKAENVPRSVS